jgi:alkylated DNA nucleotide flippase Atl1
MLLSTTNGGLTPKGTFWFFAVVTIIGGLWVWFSVPETAGRTLESMDRLFQLPWYKVGLHGYQDAQERDEVVSEKEKIAEGTHISAQHIEEKPAGSSTRV